MNRTQYHAIRRAHRRARHLYRHLRGDYAMSDRLSNAIRRAWRDSGMDRCPAPPQPDVDFTPSLTCIQSARRDKFRRWKAMGSRVNSPTYRAWWFKPASVKPMPIPGGVA